jgi:hypothetical protein
MKSNERLNLSAGPTRTKYLAAVMVGLFAGQAVAASKTYTLDGDFDLGALSGVNHTAPGNNQLQLSTVGTTFPVMWVANAGEDTLSKFDTQLNKEIARYHTWFGAKGNHGAYSGPAPSRTAVDIQGNAYVLNRHFDGRVPLLIKILAEGGIDRNGNGVIDTSVDTSNNGIIEPGEMIQMADTNANGIVEQSEIKDERVAWARQVGVAGQLGRSLCIGTDGNLWVGMYSGRTYFKVNSGDGSTITGPISTTPTAGQPNSGAWTPYGCLIDQSGVLWSASLSGLLGKISNTASNTGPYPVASFAGSFNYGIALGNNRVYLGSANQQFNPATNLYSAIGFTVGGSGIVVDGAGNIITGSTTVQKVSPAGAILWTAPLQAGGSSTVGVQVDSDNNVWQMGFTFAGTMQKYRGTDGAPLGVFPIGSQPYTYSDAAGFAARNSTNNTGTWTVTYDGGTNGTQWGTINWTDIIPAGAGVIVQARAADTQAGLPLQAYQTVTKGTLFNATGKFIQILTRLNANAADQSPVLQDLTISSVVVAVAACDVDLDQDIDRNDIGAIQSAIGTAVGAGDPRDSVVDGIITINDSRTCALRCTKAKCAP